MSFTSTWKVADRCLCFLIRKTQNARFEARSTSADLLARLADENGELDLLIAIYFFAYAPDDQVSPETLPSQPVAFLHIPGIPEKLSEPTRGIPSSDLGKFSFDHDQGFGRPLMELCSSPLYGSVYGPFRRYVVAVTSTSIIGK